MWLHAGMSWVDASPWVAGPGLLARGMSGGPLAGRTFAVKELYDVVGLPTGAGHPTRRAEAPPAERNAAAVDLLLAAGADLVGTTLTDELAWSLSGTNAHYGAPRNPAAPGRVTGGSSAGSAAVVAAGAVDIGLGSDTGGSVRLPASYCGLYGIRPTHGRVPADGMVPLAPRFDTVGILTRDAATLAAGWRALSPVRPARPAGRLVLLTDLVARCDPGVGAAVEAAASDLAGAIGLPLGRTDLADDIDAWISAFRVLQSAAAWAAHGDWYARRKPTFGPGVAERFRYASALTADEVAAAEARLPAIRARLAGLLGDDTVLVAPAAPGAAHPLDLAGEAKVEVRRRILACTVAAGLGGLPSVALPLARSPEGLPVGLCLIGAPDDDDLLVELASRTLPAG
jgi:amidase